METEDKIVVNKHETLHSIIQQLGREVTTLKNKNSISAASTVATSSGSASSTINYAALGSLEAFVPSRVELEGRRVWKNIRNHRGRCQVLGSPD